jgi:hypothetical protein
MANINRDTQRGRPSNEERAMIATRTMAALEKGERPEPPEDFTAAESKVWRKVVDALPPDWFSGATVPLLTQYCRHTAGLDFIDKTIRKIQEAKSPNLAQWKRMAQVRRQEGKVIAMLATKMRLAQTATIRRDTVRSQREAAARTAAPPSVKRPWS